VSKPPPLPPTATHPSTARVDVPAELLPDVRRLIDDAREPRPWFDLPLGIGLGMFASLLTAVFTVIVPRYEAIFRDFGVRLPTPTVVLLKLSRFVSETYAWVLCWVVAAVVPVVVARVRPWPPRHRGLGLTIGVTVTVILLGVTALAVYWALQLPMVDLIQSVSGPNR
jgi:hypothetical protein